VDLRKDTEALIQKSKIKIQNDTLCRFYLLTFAFFGDILKPAREEKKQEVLSSFYPPASLTALRVRGMNAFCGKAVCCNLLYLVFT